MPIQSKSKTKDKKNPFSQKVEKFLKNKAGKSFKRKEISKALGIHKNDYHLFRKAVSALAHSGKIKRRKGGLYTYSQSTKLFEGIIQLTRKGFGFVSTESINEDVFISAHNLNTALDGDLVEIQLLGASRRGKNEEGQVTNVTSRARDTFVGTYHKSEYYGFVVPDNQKIYRDFYIPEGLDLSAKDGQKVLLKFVKWESTQLNPEGVIIEVLGFPSEPGVDVSSVALGHGLPISFPKKLEDAAAKVQLIITKEEIAQRLDLRDELIFTIDPPDAKDFDDAVSLRRLENGNKELGVHIADVSYFVKEGDGLDKEALRRGTSVYLVDRVIPMLPQSLSNNLCSLQPDKDRLTFSCIMEIDPKGKVVNYRIKKSIINSKRRFSYREVQDIVDNNDSKDEFSKILKEMHTFSRMLRQKRIERGSIDFSTPEVRFKLDKQGQPVEIIPVEPLPSHEMIEEFMLMANQTVAKHVFKIAKNKNPNPFIYRVHQKPDQEKLQKFKEFMKALGYKITIKSSIKPSDFQAILKSTQGGANDILIKEVALRTMMKAIYSPKNDGHFGLAFDYYTHFTSPIRRYPDLVIHRLLKEYQSALATKRLHQIKNELKQICQTCSERERLALDAERESIKIKQVEWLSKHQDEEFDGIISGVMAYGVFVETIPQLIEGLIRIELMDDDYYIIDQKTYSLTGKDTGRVLRLGDTVKVKVAGIDLDRNQVDFALVTK